jgi:hypothetical protein
MEAASPKKNRDAHTAPHTHTVRDVHDLTWPVALVTARWPEDDPIRWGEHT